MVEDYGYRWCCSNSGKPHSMDQSWRLLRRYGFKLFPKDKVAAEDWQYVTDMCREALGYIAEARK